MTERYNKLLKIEPNGSTLDKCQLDFISHEVSRRFREELENHGITPSLYRIWHDGQVYVTPAGVLPTTNGEG